MKLMNGKDDKAAAFDAAVVLCRVMVESESVFERLLTAAVRDWMHGASSSGILLTDSDLKIAGWNHWLEEHTGRRSADVIGKSLLDLFPELVERGLQSHYSRALDGQVSVLSQRLHLYLIRIPIVSDFKTFSYMQQRARISPLLEGKAVIGTVTIIEDVTERVVRELELQAQLEARTTLLASEKAAREEAEEANRLKDEFLATVSHELRTPLTAIIGWSNLLRSGELDPAMTTRAVETICRNARSQTQLISDLLDVSRIISNKLSLALDDVSLPSIVETALEAAGPEAKARDIRLECEIERNLGVLRGDPERLRQVVSNLLNNALKFTPRGGTIHVRLRLTNSQAELTVKDSGIGIDPQFLPYVFDRFRQADSATTRTHGGLGLGLSIVRQLTQAHGGDAVVESGGHGKGTTFIVRLPVSGPPDGSAAPTPAATQPVPASSSSLHGLKILIVDNEQDTRDFFRAVLEGSGSQVTTLASASDALGVFESDRPDLLISDIGMPGEDGYWLIHHVRSLPANRGGQTPAVALTAYAGKEDRERVLKAGFQVHLPKPVEPVELIRAIAAAVGRKP
jgi:signal transduction histidine kinase/ActR/RegA family two-component response regulator